MAGPEAVSGEWALLAPRATCARGHARDGGLDGDALGRAPGGRRLDLFRDRRGEVREPDPRRAHGAPARCGPRVRRRVPLDARVP